MTKDELWTIVKSNNFFPRYAPDVKNYYRKIHGINTRGNIAAFTDEDKNLIREGLKRFFAEAKKVKL